jgi:N-acetylmuramic acid 6-phosphate etherase
MTQDPGHMPQDARREAHPRSATESPNPRSEALDTLSTLQIVTLMNDEDATVPTAIRPVLPLIAEAIEAITKRLRGGGRLIYAGAGTSGRLAMLDAVECVPTFSVSPRLVTTLIAGGEGALTSSIEGAEDDRDLARWDVSEVEVGDDDALVGVAASGATPYVQAALQAARERGAVTVAISNNDPAPILQMADFPIAIVTGPEVLTGSTRLKAGTAQKLVLNMISTTAMVRLGKVLGNRMIDVAVTNAKLRERAEGIVADLVGCDLNAAAALLDEADLEVKTAVLMGLRNVDAASARDRLQAVDGYLRLALDGD